MFDPGPPAPPPTGVPVPHAVPDLAPGLSEIELVADIWSADAHASREHANKLVAVARLARRRRIEHEAASVAAGGRDAPPEQADVCGALVAELALIRGCGDGEAALLVHEAVLLCGTLTATWSELFAGRITPRHASAVVDLLGPVDPAIAHRIEAAVLPRAEGRDVGWLRAAIRRMLARLDHEALERRRREAKNRRDVVRRQVGDGMSELVVGLTTGRAAAAWQTVDALARLRIADGDDRPIGVLRSEVAFDLITRPWDTSRPPVTAHVVVHAGLDALRPAGSGGVPGACEIDGAVVTAAECRSLLEQLDVLGVRQAPAGGSVSVAVHDSTGRLLATATRSELARAAGHRRTRPHHKRRPPRRTGERDDGPGLRPLPPTHRYRPSAAQFRFVAARDRSCRMPGCHRRPGRCDLDHVVPYGGGGATACENLCCLCRRHHRIKTLAPGWSFTLRADGRLVVRTPSGVVRTTDPPGWTDLDEESPLWLDETAPPDPVRT